MQGQAKIKYQYQKILDILVLGMLVCFIVACEKQESDNQGTMSNFKRYIHKGVDIVYPEDFLLVHDGVSLKADRRIIFETQNLSEFTIYFCETTSCSFNSLDRAYRFVTQGGLETNESFLDYQRLKINILGYDGLISNWVEIGASGEDIKAELTTIQFKSQPYPVFVQFYFFDEEIIDHNASITSILEGISFSPQEALTKTGFDYDATKINQLGVKRYLESIK